MAENYYTLITDIGKAKIANSIPMGTKVNLTKFKVGDSNGKYYEPTESQVDLVNTKWEGAIGSVYVDENNSNWIVVDTLIPADVGGFFIREAGIFDDQNNLIAISKLSESYKPVFEDGTTKEMLIRLILEVSNTSTISLKVDPTVILATKKDIETLTSSINSINSSLSNITKDRIYYCGTTSGTNTYTVANSEIAAYTEGLTVRIKIGTASTGASTLNINGLGAKAILDTLGNPITSGGLKAGLPYQLCYNGTNFIVLGKGGGGTADASKILASYSATVDSGQATGTIPSKAAATYNPSTSAQTIIAGQYLSGSQTINPVTGTANTAQVLSGYTFASANGIGLTGTIPSKAAATITPGTSDQTIAAGQYLSGVQTIKGDTNLVAANILGGKSIFGITGTIPVTQYASGISLIFMATYSASGTGGAIAISGLSFVPDMVIATSTSVLDSTGNATWCLGAWIRGSQYNVFGNSNKQAYQGYGSLGTTEYADLSKFFIYARGGTVATGAIAGTANWYAFKF